VIVADTHALIWWVGEAEQLSPAARVALDQGPIGVPAICCFEVAMLAQRHRIDLGIDALRWLDALLQLEKVRLLPIRPEIAVTAAGLSDPLRDPADRLIVATALHEGVPLVTKDGRIRDSGIVRTIW
jgi:PIN domain nuclease of toxin-antitoxin system